MTHIKYAEHPGVYLAEEIEARGWAQRDLAFILGTSDKAISEIVNGRRGISANMAKSLGEAFDVSPELFLNLQKNYELSTADDPDKGVASRAVLQRIYPLREMIKRGWVQDSEPDLLRSQVCAFFEVERFERIPHLKHAAKKTHYDDFPAEQLAWLFRVKHIAKEMVVPAYSETGLRDAVETMKQLRTAPQEVRHVPRLLSESGVRFVVVEGLPGAKIDGACFWLDSESPVIGMTTRYDRIDNFWFVLRHEIEHVLRRDGQGREIVDVDLKQNDSDLPEEELRANKAGGDFCIEQSEIDSFILRKGPFFTKGGVIAFARRLGVHPGLVVGQLHNKTNNYAIHRDLLVKIRSHLAPAALVDGWDNVIPVDL